MGVSSFVYAKGNCDSFKINNNRTFIIRETTAKRAKKSFLKKYFIQNSIRQCPVITHPGFSHLLARVLLFFFYQMSEQFRTPCTHWGKMVF